MQLLHALHPPLRPVRRLSRFDVLLLAAAVATTAGSWSVTGALQTAQSCEPSAAWIPPPTCRGGIVPGQYEYAGPAGASLAGWDGERAAPHAGDVDRHGTP